MAFIPFPDGIMLEAIYATPGGAAENTMWYSTSSPITTTALEELAAEWYDRWDTNVAALQSASVQLAQIRVTSMESQFAPQVEYTTSLPAAGQYVAAAILPSNVTLTCTFQTGLRGRSRRGRNFWIGTPEDKVVGDQCTLAYAEAIEDAYAFFNDIVATGATYQHCVASRQENNVVRTTGLLTPVSTYRVDTTIDSMRRRLLGRGA